MLIEILIVAALSVTCALAVAHCLRYGYRKGRREGLLRAWSLATDLRQQPEVIKRAHVARLCESIEKELKA